jgi:hypothetical protein
MRTLLISTLAIAAAIAGPAGAAGAQPIAHPRGTTSVVLRVETGGGFVAPQALLGAVPQLTLYGDGTVIVPAAGPPVSAIVVLRRFRLPEASVQALLRRARAAGLLAARTIDYGDMGSVGVSDMPTTTLAVHAGGRSVTRAAYALGVTVHGGRLSAAQARARAVLARFISTLPRRSGAAVYRPRAIAVYVTGSGPRPQSGPAPIRWPLASDLATAGAPVSAGSGFRCLAVRGSDVSRLLAILHRAPAPAGWTMGPAATTVYTVVARPLLPDERGCATR